MDPSTRMMGLDAQGNMVFTVVKPVMGIFQVSSEQTSGATQVDMGLQELSENTLLLPQAQGQAVLDQNQEGMSMVPPQIHSQMQMCAPVQSEVTSQNQEVAANASVNLQPNTQMPFAEVLSLLDPNMKGSKARKYLISYDEIKRRLQPPEKMSLRSLAAYTRVSRGPASKKTLLESLGVLGLTPSTTTSVSSYFSKLTEGDGTALCDDMKDFAHDYIDYGNMAKQLTPETNRVQHWSKIIETKNHLEDMRRCFMDPANSGAFNNVTHGLGLGMLDVALDMIVMVIEQQIRILSGAAASDPTDSAPPARRNRRRHRKTRPADGEKTLLAVGEPGRETPKARGRSKAKSKRTRQDSAAAAAAADTDSVPMDTHGESCKADGVEDNVLTLVSVGYQTVSSGLSAATAV